MTQQLSGRSFETQGQIAKFFYKVRSQKHTGSFCKNRHVRYVEEAASYVYCRLKPMKVKAYRQYRLDGAKRSLTTL